MSVRKADGSAGDADYGRIGAGYSRFRQPEPAIARLIEQALGDARTVLNVGAGAGSYEPAGRQVTPVEPSAAMRAERPADLPVAVDAAAEELPFADRSFDAAMASFTIHQWRDLERGLGEMRRVTRGPVVILSCDPERVSEFWLNDYAPDVLANDPGALNRVMGHGLGRMVFQFRSFVMGAWARHLMHNIHMRDWETATTFLLTGLGGVLTHIAYSHYRYASDPRREEKLDRALSWQGLLAGGFQRTSWSSFVPTAADSVLALAGQDPVFGFRMSGQASNFLTGNPTFSLVMTCRRLSGPWAGTSCPATTTCRSRTCGTSPRRSRGATGCRSST
ncbi:class I SAM-dependent methyltransferase [Bosea sp. (in: a-proteobacteria)]|uniref:class I SAM-dependent methyltransferase n=1 Tax=Bosea sp. (in: a-proteobacteria) TaxID=1871050 RepID=UPI002633834B|nr:class I SAM-dependent methyltransferase [Bosea sp. (in: a-proteobacteria)]MCO5092978.1 class I SAM-dependent methyltransferase [Bosea sp. (in: a-proteobacteria)]